jgi:hypothetical protein
MLSIGEKNVGRKLVGKEKFYFFCISRNASANKSSLDAADDNWRDDLFAGFLSATYLRNTTVNDIVVPGFMPGARPDSYIRDGHVGFFPRSTTRGEGTSAWPARQKTNAVCPESGT